MNIINNINILGESPIWNYMNNKFYWVDILDYKIKSYDDHNILIYNIEKKPTCLALLDINTIFCAVEDGVGVYDFRINTFNYIDRINATNIRLNDGKTDRYGVFHIGSMDRTEKDKIGDIYKFTNNKLNIIESSIGISNGISFSTDNKFMYYSDSLTGEIFKKNTLTNDKNVIYKYNDYSPDGSTIDINDNYYSCLWGGSRIDIFKDNIINDSIDINCKYPTCCCFGGSDMNKLFITSASLLNNSDNNGKIFIKNMKCTGIYEQPIFLI